ncbi:MAG: HIT family protein [Deltaproteobacteria bacterium]|nr:HIT family protein [Deltaproteobacteria bacterium]
MEECIFCKIVKGEIPCKKVYENDKTLAFLDINPRNKGHVLVIPKNHYLGITDMSDNDAAETIKTIKLVAAAQRDSIKTQGMSLLQSNGRVAGQMVPHIHFHLIPRTEEEKGLGLESVLPVKKFEDAEFDKIANDMNKAIPKGSATTQSATPVQETKPMETKQEAEESDEPSEESKKKLKEEINFDF